ncbi:MAG TPA: shikimate dehydrogenase [Candidatus Binatia bacterium]|nr:shikimate dehydrogenase [Candidatus Binatia bacterium]
MARRATPIDGRTAVVAVLGDPVAHSRSPAMHNAAFRAAGLPYVYVAFRVDSRDVGPALAGVRALGIRGVNVTVPHKQAVIPHVDRLTERARACGAVNSIANRDGVLEGDNTDVLGLDRDLSAVGLAKRRLASAVVLGAGGSARAAVVALGRRARRVAIAARRPEQAAELARALAPVVSAELAAVDLAELAPGRAGARATLADAGVVVNTTPVGMRGERFVPLAYDVTRDDCLFYDLIYTARKTPFLAPAARLRRPTANGIGMLLHQGAASFEAWTGVRAPLDAMRRALRRA